MNKQQALNQLNKPLNLSAMSKWQARVDAEDMRARLGDFFDNHQLWMIEYAFECWRTGEDSRYDRAAQFGLSIAPRHADGGAKKRMLAIMQNIIDNDGTFTP